MSRRVKRQKESTRDRLLMWIKHCSDVNFGIWIECVECKKWRKCYTYCESHEVEENWCCSMNTMDGGKKGSCDDPEEGVMEEYLEYSPGSIVWAKLEGYPWWPAMVDVDPDIEEYFWSEKSTMFYHVTFLDDHVTRSWISSKCLSPFSRRLLNSKLQKKYFAAILKAEEKANIAIKMTLKERLEMFSFVHLYKGKWPLATDFDSDEEENAHNITNILLEEVDDLDSLNSFDSEMIENNTLPEKEEPKRSPPTGFQTKKNKIAVGYKSSYTHSDVENCKNSPNESIKKLKSTASKEKPSNAFKLKSKLSLMKKKSLSKSRPNDMLGDISFPPNKTSDEIKERVISTDTAFGPCGSIKKLTSEANKKIGVLENGLNKLNNPSLSNDDLYMDQKSENSLNLKSNINSKSDCFDELLKELDHKRVEISIPQDSETSDTNISRRFQDISDLEKTDNLSKCIEWVVKSFKITEENQGAEKSKPVNSKKLKTLNSPFENISQDDNKENISKNPTSVNKREEFQKNKYNEAKRIHKDTGTEKRKIPFKSVLPKNINIEEKTLSKNSLSVKKSKDASFSLIKTPATCEINKRKDSENLSSSNENTSHKKLKPSFQGNVKSVKPQEKVKKPNFKVPLSDTIKILSVPKIAEKEESMVKSNKICNGNSDWDSKCVKVVTEEIDSKVDEDLKFEDSLNDLNESGSEGANVLNAVDKEKNILREPESIPKIPHKNNIPQERENSEENTEYLQNHKNDNSSNNEVDSRFLNNLEKSESKDGNVLNGTDKNYTLNSVSSFKHTILHKNNSEKCTEEDTDLSDFSLSKNETKSCKSAAIVTSVSDDEDNSENNGIVSSETNNKDDCFFDILVSDDEC